MCRRGTDPVTSNRSPGFDCMPNLTVLDSD
jgi:hypothetical protein